MFKKLIIIVCTLFNINLYAEVTTDGTLGRVETFSNHFTITEDLGQQRGSNLFHSFRTFNIKTGESATFTGSDSISNIITRVTGDSQSTIDGTLRSEISNANFYLLNPHGILFGEHARLDISGSFHASTADYIRLGKNERFYANLAEQSVLSIASPNAFGFLDNPTKPIEIQGSSLTVLEGQTLSMIGGDLQIEDGTLLAPSGQINLVAVGDNMNDIVPLSAMDLANPVFNKRGKITLSESSLLNRLQTNSPANVDVSGDGGGQIFIRAGQFYANASLIFAHSLGDKPGAHIDIMTTEKVHLSHGASIAVANKGNAQGGKITINTKGSLILSAINEAIIQDILEKNPNPTIPDDLIPTMSSITANNFKYGTGGSIYLTTSTLDISPGLIRAATEGSGNAGNIVVDTGTLTLDKNGYIEAATVGYGQAGNIMINATNSVTLMRDSTISVSSDSSGYAGNIDLKTQHLHLDNVGEINSFSRKSGNAGSINITTNTALLTNRSAIATQAEQAGGGNITLKVNNHLELTDDIWITARAKGKQPQHKGGNIIIENPGIFTLENSQLLANAYAGNGGKIDIRTDQLNLLGNNQIDVSSELGLNGQLILNSTKLKDEFLVLSAPTFQKIDLSLSHCTGLSKEDASRFFAIARDVPPITPRHLRNHLYIPGEDEGGN